MNLEIHIWRFMTGSLSLQRNSNLCQQHSSWWLAFSMEFSIQLLLPLASCQHQPCNEVWCVRSFHPWRKSGGWLWEERSRSPNVLLCRLAIPWLGALHVGARQSLVPPQSAPAEGNQRLTGHSALVGAVGYEAAVKGLRLWYAVKILVVKIIFSRVLW